MKIAYFYINPIHFFLCFCLQSHGTAQVIQRSVGGEDPGVAWGAPRDAEVSYCFSAVLLRIIFV